MSKRRSELTFRHNLERGRHGWLRLTPAYSVKVVQQILQDNPSIRTVLDPFSGTGTTGLVCAEYELRCDLLDINPFLIWLARVKATSYTSDQLDVAQHIAADILETLKHPTNFPMEWIPPIHHIERWWKPEVLGVLSNLYKYISEYPVTDEAARNILLIAFCRLLIDSSNAAFNHPSMSFKTSVANHDSLFLLLQFQQLVEDIVDTASGSVGGQIRVFCADSRFVPMTSDTLYDAVITSPPYPNRMSYIRELRPYMYWLGYLHEPRDAGELDWQAIGGTWGIATSRLEKWQPELQAPLPLLTPLLEKVKQRSPVLANYIYKYFIDIRQHIASVSRVLNPKAQLHYVVGNSKFFDTVVPVEEIYALLFKEAGFSQINIHLLRKRNSKKELFEFVVSARS